MEADLGEIAHRALPQRVEALRQTLRERAVVHQERREPAIRHERVIEQQLIADAGFEDVRVEGPSLTIRIAEPAMFVRLNSGA